MDTHDGGYKINNEFALHIEFLCLKRMVEIQKL